MKVAAIAGRNGALLMREALQRQALDRGLRGAFGALQKGCTEKGYRWIFVEASVPRGVELARSRSFEGLVVSASTPFRASTPVSGSPGFQIV